MKWEAGCCTPVPPPCLELQLIDAEGEQFERRRRPRRLQLEFVEGKELLLHSLEKEVSRVNMKVDQLETLLSHIRGKIKGKKDLAKCFDK